MKANILIVEDEEALALLLRYNLEAEGYGVETVPRGDEADLLLKEHSPDLVILDWMLPGLSGIELCRRLRARPIAARAARAARRRAVLRRPRGRPREEARLARRPRDRSRPDRISAARISDGAARSRVLARTAPQRRVGQRNLYRRAHRRRPCRPAAQGAQPRSRYRSYPHRPRRRLCAR